MTNDGYKSCRILRKQVLSTVLKIRYTYTKYSSVTITASVAEWLAYFPFNSYIPGSSRVARNCFSQNISWLKGHWNVPTIQSTEWWLKCDWNPPFSSTFSHHSVDWMVRFHPVYWKAMHIINRFCHCIKKDIESINIIIQASQLIKF